MSAIVKLASKMPGDPETNGVDTLRDDLCQDPDTLRVALVWFDTLKITHDVDADDDVPTIRLRRIEPLGDVGDVDPEIRDAVQAAVERRTGRKAIPFGLVEISTDGAYGDPDQATIDDELEEDIQ